MKQPIRAFSLGIMVSTALLAVVYFYLSEERPPTESYAEPLSNKEMIQQLEAEGYFVFTEEPIGNSQQEPEEKPIEEEQLEEEPIEEEADEKTENEPENMEEDKSFTLVIEEGMDSYELVDKLSQAGMVEDKEDFSDYIITQGYSTRIQVGEYLIREDMSYQEIAETITGA